MSAAPDISEEARAAPPRLRPRRARGLALLGLLLAVTAVFAQFQGGRSGGRNGGRGGRGGASPGGGFGGNGRVSLSPGGADKAPQYPELDWPVDPAFRNDLFTFARLRWSMNPYARSGSGQGWATDTQAADDNLAFRLHQMTSLKVNPGEHDIDITPAQLARHPFVYIVEPGRLGLSPQEAADLRKYLLNGGFLMVDDFWGEEEWSNLYEQMTHVFPELPRGLRQNTSGANLEGDIHLRELPLEHPIFHQVFDLKAKPQMPAIGVFERTGLTYETNHVGDTSHVHFKGIFDKHGRMMVFISHNNDFGDGWEREGESPEYFRHFSEPQAYPMMINILFYAMTH